MKQMRFLVIYLIGVIFGTGIVISGMANPAKVINFFDVAGTWDPSLAFVMGGALIVTAIGYRWSSAASARSSRPVQPADRAQDRRAPCRRLGGLRHRLGHRGLLPGRRPARARHRQRRTSDLHRPTIPST
jgi:hypothetical protein